MEKKIYTIRDTKSETFGLPFYQNTHAEAERSFAKVAQDPQSTISQFPEDFDLYYLGTYSDQTGQVTALDTPHHIAKAINLKQS